MQFFFRPKQSNSVFTIGLKETSSLQFIEAVIDWLKYKFENSTKIDMLISSSRYIHQILRLFLTVVVITVGSSTLYAKERIFHFMANTGSQTGVLTQDQDGFIWIGTQDGAVKFDGKNMKRYSTENSQISNNMVSEIYEDSLGLIWMGTKDGLSVYNKDTDSFKVYRHDPADPDSISSSSLSSNYGSSLILEDSNGFLWIGTDKGLNRYDRKRGKFTAYFTETNSEKSLTSNQISAIFEDSQNRLWVGTDMGLNLLNPVTKELQHFTIDTFGLSDNAITSIMEDSMGYLWVGTKKGLNQINLTGNTLKVFKYNPGKSGGLPFQSVDRILETREGEIWLSTFVGKQKGLAIFNRDQETFEGYQGVQQSFGSLSTDAICDIYQDRDGNIWLPSFSGPVDIYYPGIVKFTSYIHDKGDPNSILPEVITTAHEDASGTIWFASTSGIIRYDRKAKKFDKPLKGYVAAGITSDPSGQIWFSGADSLVHYDPNMHKIIKTFPMKPNSYANHFTFDPQNPDIIWMGTTVNGFARFNRQSEQFTYYAHEPNNPESLSENSMTAFVRTKRGLFLIPTLGGGLNVFDSRSKKVVKYYQHQPDDPKSLSSDSLNHILQAKNGTIWLATSKGLDKFDAKKGKMKTYSRKTGFPANNIMALIEDNQGILWIGSKQGLIRFNPDTEKAKVFTEADGLPSNEFWEYRHLKANDGSLWFGTPKGAFSFYPDQIKDNRNIPEVYLTSLKQGGIKLQTGAALEKLHTIQLDWKNNFFEFEFIALNYIYPQKNQYQYILEGFDKDWYSSGTMTNARYSGLPAGEYALKIKGSNNDSVWNEKGTAIQVIVTAPWWQSAWFKWLIGLLILISGPAIYFLRVRNIKGKNRELETRVQEKTKDLQEALDNIKTLKGLVPICAHCKKIRDDQGYWNRLESYIEEHSDAQFSHGICEECTETLYSKEPWYRHLKGKDKDK